MLKLLNWEQDSLSKRDAWGRICICVGLWHASKAQYEAPESCCIIFLEAPVVFAEGELGQLLLYSIVPKAAELSITEEISC
jgi:hypothetical protein